jgi:hypothetical protein
VTCCVNTQYCMQQRADRYIADQDHGLYGRHNPCSERGTPAATVTSPTAPTALDTAHNLCSKSKPAATAEDTAKYCCSVAPSCSVAGFGAAANCIVPLQTKIQPTGPTFHTQGAHGFANHAHSRDTPSPTHNIGPSKQPMFIAGWKTWPL